MMARLPPDYGGPQPGSTAHMSGASSAGDTDTDEEEAKERAKEILQEFLRNKARAAEVERQLSRSFEENEGLIRLLQDKKHEMASDRERHQRDAEQMRQKNAELLQQVEASKHEIRKVAQTCAQRTADTAVQLQHKEQECDRLDEELGGLKHQHRELRSECERLRAQRDELERSRGEVPEKAQQRIAELARRILEISRDKATADQSVMEANDKVAAAMKTVDEFRNMQRESVAKIEEGERARDSDRARFEATIKGLQQELEMQTTLYKKYVERLGAMQQQQGKATDADGLLGQYPHASTGSSVYRSPQRPVRPAAQLSELQQQLQQQLSLLEQKLAEKDQHCRELQDALNQSRQQLEDHWKESVREKQLQFEQLREAQRDSDQAMMKMKADLETAQDRIRSQESEKKNFDSMVELYEQVKAERDDLRKECFTAAVEAETTKRTQAELNEQLRQHAIDRAAQEKLAEELFKERDARERAERELRQRETHYAGELEQAQQQVKVHGESYKKGQEAGEAKMKLESKEKERERAVLDSELVSVRKDLDETRADLDAAKQENVRKDKEIKDWCSAFQTAEKHKAAIAAQYAELEKDKRELVGEKGALELRNGTLQQSVERLERQLREEQERADRLTQQGAEKDLQLAQVELDFRDRELRMREQSTQAQGKLERDHAAASLADKQKIQREMEMMQREASLREQAGQREQERSAEASAASLASKELEIAALKREVGQLRGQQGQLQNSLQSALGQVAQLGQQYAVAVHAHAAPSAAAEGGMAGSPYQIGKSPSRRSTAAGVSLPAYATAEPLPPPPPPP